MAVELRSRIEELTLHFDQTYRFTQEDESYWHEKIVDFPPDFQDMLYAFLRFSIPHFPEPPDRLIFLEMINYLRSHPQFQTQQYLELLQTILVDAATIGFNHIDLGFKEVQILRPHNSPYEPELLFALRVYISDVLIQTTAVKRKTLENARSLLQDPYSTLPITTIPAILGTFFPIRNGVVTTLRNPAYVRRGFSGIYIPDMECATIVCEYIGTHLGREIHANRADTFKILCDNQNLGESLEALVRNEPDFAKISSQGLRFPLVDLIFVLKTPTENT